METVTNNNSDQKKIIFGILLLILFFSLFFIWKIYLQKKNTNIPEVTKQQREINVADAYMASMLGNNPKPIQQFVLNDAKNSINDKYTKAAAYFLTHRYFDNGGNIYEITDFVQAHPELSFLKDAALIYPAVFLRIQNRTLPPVHSDSALYAYLAGLEVLDRNGLSDIATLGTLANQYAALAYFAKLISTEHPTGIPTYIARDIQRDINKSVYFQKKADQQVTKILNHELTTDDIDRRSLLVGLNQYASSLRYLKALGVNVSSTKTPEEVLAFDELYSKSFMPELAIFTTFLNASTLRLDPTANPNELKRLLTPIFTFDTNKLTPKKGSVIWKIISAKDEKPIYFEGTTIEDKYYDLYSKYNVILLAKKVPEFKNWLISQGWKESSFK